MTYLSKSKYCALWQCPKIVWLHKYRPDEMFLDDSVLSRMAVGNEVGAIARQLFGDSIDVTAYKYDKIDLNQMIENTKAEIMKGTNIICEASFEFNGLFCSVDILKKDSDGWSIYEVKSSTSEDKAVYYADLAYQKYVLEHCGIKIISTYIVCLDNNYIFDGILDLNRLFKITDVSKEINDEIFNKTVNLSIAERLLVSDKEPDIDLSESCQNPYLCAFWKYCSRNLPNPSVFDLYRLPAKSKFEYYRKGWITYRDILLNVYNDNKIRILQLNCELNDSGTVIDKKGIKSFLSTLSFPLYFLDFETIQPAIPQYIGTKPYQQIPFQYSLHYIETPNGELKHKEFLGISGTDPRRDLADQLCRDIPYNVCTLVYNKSFECTRIKELAKEFPDLAEHLLNIESNIKDLLVPFKSGYYYNKMMKGSFSIKSVLPAIFPNDPELNYNNLEGVHNGSEAMTVFPKIKDMPPEEADKTRRNLLKYCKLDTYAMVKIWQELARVSQ